MTLNIAIACGGTGGHIFPGLAVGEVLKTRGHLVTLWLAGKDIENEALNEWDGEVVTVQSRGFQGRNIFSAVKTVFTLMKVARECRRKMAANRPDILLAMGSYASIGPVLAADKLGAQVVLHEANVIPGRAINWLLSHADRVALSFEETSYYLKRKGVDVTGMPLRAELRTAAESVKDSGLPDKPFTILIMGGSRGAHRLNDICVKALCALREKGVEFEVIHLAGVDDEQEVRSKYTAAGVRHSVYAFCHDMAVVYRQTDMTICRSGASTCAEINAFAIPSLLIPYPHAVKGHQMANARAMEDRGCANLIAEENLTDDWLTQYLDESITNPVRLERMRQAAVRHSLHSGSEKLADLIESQCFVAGKDVC